MKTIYTFTFLIAALTGVSQITLDSSDFAMVGDTFTIVDSKNPKVIDVKGGANATWNFSMLTVDSLSGAKVRAIDKSKYPIDSLFPDADVKITSRSFGESYLIKNKDSVVLDGVANMQLVAGNAGFTFNFVPNIKIMEFPMKYLDAFTSLTIIDTVIDTAITALSFDSLRIRVEFEFDSKVEGYGKLITTQDTFDVLKLYSREARSFKIFGHHTTLGWINTPFITQNDTLHNYRWFAKGIGYQVAEASADEKDGTTQSASYQLVARKLFAFISDSIDPTCYGLSDGRASVSATGGSGTFSYKWSNGSGLSTITNIPSGNYSVTVTDVGASKTFVTGVSLIDPDSLSTTLISKKDEGPLPNTGEIEITVTGGKAPYTYAWDKSSSTSKLASDLAGGKHTISVTDKNGCRKDTAIIIGSTVGIEQFSTDKLLLFPNPIKDFLNITGLTQEAKITVLDLTGKIAFEQSISPTIYAINLSELKSGIYLIKINQGQNIDTYRLVKD